MPETLTVQPYDVRNQFLVSNVRPPEWANPEPAERYNPVVLGAGTASLCLMPNHFHLAPFSSPTY